MEHLEKHMRYGESSIDTMVDMRNHLEIQWEILETKVLNGMDAVWSYNNIDKSNAGYTGTHIKPSICFDDHPPDPALSMTHTHTPHTQIHAHIHIYTHTDTRACSTFWYFNITVEHAHDFHKYMYTYICIYIYIKIYDISICKLVYIYIMYFKCWFSIDQCQQSWCREHVSPARSNGGSTSRLNNLGTLHFLCNAGNPEVREDRAAPNTQWGSTSYINSVYIDIYNIIYHIYVYFIV